MLTMEEDRNRWDARHSARHDPDPARPEAPEALALLDAETLAHVPTAGLAVDIACGLGGQAVWLAQRGMRVLAIDVSPVAIDRTRAAAAEHGVTDLIDARVVDLDGGLPRDAVGAGLVVCQRFRAPALYAQIVDALAVGGFGLVTVLSEVGLVGEPGQFHARSGELIEAFPPGSVDVLASSEQAGVASIVFRRR